MAYRKGYKFHKTHKNTPGVYSYVISDMQATKTDGAKKIAIIGKANGGKPHEIMFLDDAELSKEVLKGGDLLDACLKAYDPVLETKTGVELGGADLIMAIRSNEAKQSESTVFAKKEANAEIGEVAKTVNKSTTGKLTVSGDYTGKQGKTFKVYITSEGTKDLAECTYNYVVVGEDKPQIKDLELSNEENKTNKDLGDGVTVTFGEGNYTKGDTFLIPCKAKSTQGEPIFVIKSKDYGEDCNLLSHKIDDGTEKGTKRLSVHNAKSDEYEVFDDVGGAFSLKYNGEQQYATLDIISDGNGKAIKLQTKIGASKEQAITDLDINLDEKQFKTVKQLINHLLSYENYEVEPVNIINSELTVNDFDFVKGKNIKEKCPVTAVIKDLEKTTKTQSYYVEITVKNRESAEVENYPYTPLVGGTEGLEPASYLKLLDKLSHYDIDYIVPLTDDLSIIAECREHCLIMSERYGKERRLICGLGNGLSAQQAIINAKKLAHPRVQYFGEGFYDYNQKLYPAYIAAAMHAGRAAFLGVESATADIYNILKPEKTFSERERRELIDNGVMFFDEQISDIDYKQFYAKLVWDYTTYTEKDDPLLVERSTGAIADQLSKKVRKALDKMLTGKLTPTGVLESARNKVISILQDDKKKGIILDYRNVTIKKIRDKTLINFEVAPTQINNFTFIDITFVDEGIELKGLDN